MRILFTNLAKTATITTDTPNGNYPVTNLVHSVLRKRYQGASTIPLVTITFAATSSINCFFYGYHNLQGLELRLYDSGDTLLQYVSGLAEVKTGAAYFDTVDNVAYATLQLAVPVQPAYLGGIGLGEYYQVGRPNADFQEGFIDNSVKVSSPTGQVQQTRVEPIGSDNYQVSGMLRAEYIALIEQINAVGQGAPLWIDVFYLNHSYKSPMYGTFYNVAQAIKSGKYFALPFELREVR